MSLRKEDSEKLEEFRTKVSSISDNVVFRVFPAKILYEAFKLHFCPTNSAYSELTALIDSTSSTDSPFHINHATALTDARVYPSPTHTDPNGPSKRKRTEDGHVSSPSTHDTANAHHPELVHANKRLLKLSEIIKAECAQLCDSCDKVKLWVNLTMPKIEDGDNFGVQIQEEVLSELLRSQESSYNVRDSIRQHYLARAKICSKLIKYPHIEDYTLALKEHDEKQLFFARQNLVDIRNIYAVMTDILHKNIAKIRSPRGNNRASLY